MTGVPHAAGNADTGWSGTLLLKPGLLAFTGRIGAAAAHTHACLQILAVTAGVVHVHDRHGDSSRIAPTAVIPAGTTHTITADPAAKGLIAYLDPASPAARTALNRIAGAGPSDRVATWTGVGIGGAGPDAPPLHLALRRAMDIGRHHADGPPDLVALAEAIGLSASRLGHLFHDQLGLPYPLWRRWTRLRHAIDHVRNGATLTDAAHAVGFADSAHLTRTCRAMFGITPTEALRATGWRT
ncbi:AraC family transcriptional regulator [Micromonospora sp. NPDC048843]|uniref:helix-turn-helix transcriptional regulator n=1 Tax=Micromonospora sp. NPDC048843 TaxID=3155389 RepID=UPI003408A225